MNRVLLFTIGLGMVLGLAGLGCSGETPAPGAPGAPGTLGDVTPISQDGGSACARPDEGCSCAAGAGPVTCYGEPVASAAGVVCDEGARYCRDGYWSGCETIRTYTLSPAIAATIDGPTACNRCNPHCYNSNDTPTDVDLTPSNATGVVYDPSAGGITLPGTTGGTGTLVDTDGDGVPDTADDYPSDSSRWNSGGGFYHTLAYGGPSVFDPLNFDVQVTTADVYFLMDTTGSMGGEISNLRSTITSGIFIPGCPGGVIGAIRCTIPDAWFGVGSHDDYPVDSGIYVACDSDGCYYTADEWYGYAGDDDLPYRNFLNINSSVSAAQSSVNSLSLHWGADWPESQTQALYAIATGGALPFVSAAPGCGGGRWGYPCFRPDTIPIIILFTDAAFHNGPDSSHNYDTSLVNGADPPATVKTWADTVAALTTKRIRVISVISTDMPSDDSRGTALYDAEALGIATGSIDGFGNPYVETINTDGSGLGTAVVDAVVNLANYSRYDVSARATDNPATSMVDERGFVQSISAVSFPSGRCTGQTASTFVQCLPGTNVNFKVTFKNDIVMPTSVAQVFNFTIQVLLDGTTVQATIPVRIVVPPSLPAFPPSGRYHRDYDATVPCTIPPERPDWGMFTWTASTPSDSNIRFEIRTADTLAALPTATPAANITVPGTPSPQDIGVLLTPGAGNYHPYLRVTAVLNASSDRTVAPTLINFSLQFTCAAAE